MPRTRSPNRDKAFEIYKEYKGDITNREIARLLNEDEKVIAVWKQRDKWAIGTKVVQHKNQSCTTKEISWIDIENEYVIDIRKKPCSLKSLANKYNLDYDYLRRYASENSWGDKREKYITNTSQKIQQKSSELISTDLAKATAKHLNISDKLLNEIEKALADNQELHKYVIKLRTGYGPGEFDDKIITSVMDALNDAKLLNIVNAMDKLQKMQRQALGILDERDKVKIEIDREKISIDRAMLDEEETTGNQLDQLTEVIKKSAELYRGDK